MVNHRRVELSIKNRKEWIILPITPQTITVARAQMNQAISLLNVGEVNLLGNEALEGLSISSFFPGSRSPFRHLAQRTPWGYMNLLNRWRIKKELVRVIITDSQINMACTIEALTPELHEGDQDLYYTIDLKEYKLLNTARVKKVKAPKVSGLKDRPDTSQRPRYHDVLSAGDTYYYLAVKYYADAARWKDISKANGDRALQVGSRVVIP